MEFSQYKDEVYELLLLTQKNRFNDPRGVMQYAEKLIMYAQQTKDGDLLGYAYYCIGDAYYTLSDTNSCFHFMNLAMKEFNSVQDWLKLGECYNLIGILFAHQGNYTSALDSYFEAIELVESYKLDYLGAMVYENYSELCDRTENKEEALENVLLSKKYAMNICDHPRWHYLMTAILVTAIKSYLNLFKVKEARIQLDELNEMLKDCPEEQVFDVQLVGLLQAHAEHDEIEEARLLKATVDSFMKCTYKIDYFWSCVEFMIYLEKTHNDIVLEQVIRQMELILEGEGFPDLQFRICRFKIDLLYRQSREQELTSVLLEYCHYADEQKKLTNRSLHMFTELRKSLRTFQKTNVMLLEKAETDSLTGIANRRRLSEEIDQYFESSYKNKVNFGVEMIDIDRFKIVNDTYGHHIGDECLIVVADALKSLALDRIFCARYGGDEFFILYIDYTDNEIKDVCNQMSEKVKELLREKKLPVVTISQGICNKIPNILNKAWDFTSLADQALYIAKKRGRNHISFVHHKGELENDILSLPC